MKIHYSLFLVIFFVFISLSAMKPEQRVCDDPPTQAELLQLVRRLNKAERSRRGAENDEDRKWVIDDLCSTEQYVGGLEAWSTFLQLKSTPSNVFFLHYVVGGALGSSKKLWPLLMATAADLVVQEINCAEVLRSLRQKKSDYKPGDLQRDALDQLCQYIATINGSFKEPQLISLMNFSALVAEGPETRFIIKAFIDLFSSIGQKSVQVTKNSTIIVTEMTEGLLKELEENLETDIRREVAHPLLIKALSPQKSMQKPSYKHPSSNFLRRSTAYESLAALTKQPLKPSTAALAQNS